MASSNYFGISNGRKSALLASAALAGAGMLAPRAHASMTINLLFADGTTSKSVTPANNGQNFAINVYAVITGASAVTTSPSSGSATVNQPPSTGNHDGLQFVYFSVLSSIGNVALAGTSSSVPGSINTHSLNSNVPFNATGSLSGTVQDINGDGISDLGSTSVPSNTDYIKPRSGGAPNWENYAPAIGGNGAKHGASNSYQSFGSPDIVISADKKSVSFRVERLTYHVNAVATGESTKFQVVLPTFTDAPKAQYWQDSPNENQGTGALGDLPGGYSAGTSVLLFDQVFEQHPIIDLSNHPVVGFGTLLQHSATPGANQATFSPNSGDNRIHVPSSPSGYTPGYANNINSTGTPKGSQINGVEVTGFSPSSDDETYALNILVNGAAPTGAQLTQIIADINNRSFSVTATTVSPFLAGLLGNGTDGTPYDIQLTLGQFSGLTPTGDEDLSWNFGNEQNIGGVTVQDVAAIPEPATSAGLLIGASGLLLGRRKSKR